MNTNERRSTTMIRQKIRDAYDKLIHIINSEAGVVKIAEGVSINVSKNMRRSDIYSIVSELTGLGLSEKTIERYIKEYITESK